MGITAVRTVIIYIVLIAAMRLMGRRQLGELQPIELVVTLLISDLACVPMQDSGIPLLSGLIPIAILVALEILLSALMLKSPRFSCLVSGNPLLLVKNGKLDQAVLKKLRLSIEDLSDSLRKQNVFDLRDIQTAIAETNGSITVYPVAQKRALTYADLGGPPQPNRGMPLVVLADGETCDWAMQACGIDEKWVRETLRKEGFAADGVLMMTANAERDYTIVPKEIAT